jgi:hypothetical protein
MKEREREWKREREWTGENHERGKKNLASGTVCGTVQRESTQSVYHFWTLCDWSENVWIGLFLVAVS